MCTSLSYVDASGAQYHARTLELDVSEPYFVTFVPSGTGYASQAPGHDAVSFVTTRAFVSVSSPSAAPPAGQGLGLDLLKPVEGVNDAGLTFTLNAYPTVDLGGHDDSTAVLEAIDLGSWILGMFTTVAEVTSALADQPIHLTRLQAVGNVPFPFHIGVRDRTGAEIVIEWVDGVQHVFDNPVGVLTNSPAFPWHLTNLGNWSHLTNIDQPSGQFGSLAVAQPDPGIATAALPASNTAVGRFVRAAYYGRFAEKVSDPDAALTLVSRIINNFDRPRGATVDLPGGPVGVKFEGTNSSPAGQSTEFTAITNVTDLARGRFLVRSYEAFNYSRFDLDRLASVTAPLILPLGRLDPLGGDANDQLLATA
ncbi:MAG: linear amide C-N hydrolase [Mycetocola sp.]